MFDRSVELPRLEAPKTATKHLYAPGFQQGTALSSLKLKGQARHLLKFKGIVTPFIRSLSVQSRLPIVCKPVKHLTQPHSSPYAGESTSEDSRIFLILTGSGARDEYEHA